MQFASDNTAPVPEEVMAALTAANRGAMSSYGADPLMEEVRARIRTLFEAPEAEVHLVATGTAANALSLACLVQPWQTVYCHRHAHVAEDECGAPEFYTGGAKLTLLEGAHARIAPQTLAAVLEAAGSGGVHQVQKGALTLTNATENGTVYSVAEVEALTTIARSHGVPVHMDGARFANALATTNASPARMTWRAGIDILSLGGTKNGLLGVEAVVIFDPALSWEFELRRKRGGHLFSKHRYLSAQMNAWLTDGLWLRLARHANAMAKRLSDGIAALPGATLLHPTEANAVFAAWPRAGHLRAQAAGASYYLWPFHQSLEGPPEEPLSARLVCSWATTEEEVDRLLTLLRG